MRLLFIYGIILFIRSIVICLMLSSYQPVQWPSWPVYTQSDSDAVLAVIRSNQLFAADQVQLFESHFSSYIGVEHAVAAMQDGATDYLQKPFEASSLVSTVT